MGKSKLIILILILMMPFLSAELPRVVLEDPDAGSSEVNIFQGNLTNLSEMQDVTITSAADGDFFKYDIATQNWINFVFGGDTNASTECSGAEVLLGNTSCHPLTPFLAAGTDTNETGRVENLTALDCSGTDKVVGVQANGTVLCGADQDSGAGTADGNASSICSGDSTYLSGEGNCNDVSTFYINITNESNLNVNSSIWWANMSSTNSSQFDIVSGALHIIDSWLQSFVQNLLWTTDFNTSVDDRVTGTPDGSLNSTSWNRSGDIVHLANLEDDVGINTTNPVTLLEVLTEAVGEGAVLGNAFAGVWNGGSDYAVFTHKDFRTTTNNYAFIQNSDGAVWFNAVSGQSLIFTIGAGAARMVISGNNVGIGTSTPQSTLNVVGGVNITSSLNVSEIPINGSTYNATYDNYANNVSINHTKETFDAYDTRWSASAQNYSHLSNFTNDEGFITSSQNYSHLSNFTNDGVFITTSQNDTYDNYANNVSINHTRETYLAYESRWNNTDISNWTSNSSTWWYNMNSTNSSQFEIVLGALHLIDSWLTSFIDAWFGTKTTDDLTQGSTNLYNNDSLDQNITAYDCSGTDKVIGHHPNGTVNCGVDLNTGGVDGSFNSTSWNRSGTIVILANPTDNVEIGNISLNSAGTSNFTGVMTHTYDVTNVTSNSTCMIIKGATSTLEIC